MKQCPKCKSVFPPDNDYCLIDGNLLEAASRSSNKPTEILQRPLPNQVAAVGNSSKWLYAAIGGIGAVVIAAVLFIILSAKNEPPGDKFTKVGNPREIEKSTIAATVTPTVNTATNLPRRMPATNVSVAGRWSGDWSSPSGAYLTIVVDLSDNGSGQVNGQIEWTLRRTRRPEKMNKIGMSAIEYVSGQFDQTSRALTMKGYRKDDPNNVLVMLDDYRLNLSADGNHLNGSARNGGKWNATIKLAR